MEKITKREMYEALITLATTGVLAYEGEDGRVEIMGDELKAFAENEIELLDKKAAKAKERAATKRIEGDELTAAVRDALSDEFESIADIAARVESTDVSVAKVQYRLGQLAKNGEAEKSELTIPASEGGKARKLVGYRRMTVSED